VEQLRRYIDRVELHPTSVQIVLRRRSIFVAHSDPDQELATLARRLEAGETVQSDESRVGLVRMTIPCRMNVHGGRT
jgi:hypothetical protein